MSPRTQLVSFAMVVCTAGVRSVPVIWLAACGSCRGKLVWQSKVCRCVIVFVLACYDESLSSLLTLNGLLHCVLPWQSQIYTVYILAECQHLSGHG